MASIDPFKGFTVNAAARTASEYAPLELDFVECACCGKFDPLKNMVSLEERKADCDVTPLKARLLDYVTAVVDGLQWRKYDPIDAPDVAAFVETTMPPEFNANDGDDLPPLLPRLASNAPRPTPPSTNVDFA